MSAGTLAVTPLTETVGARIDGVDLSGPFAPDAIEAIRAALFEHVVLVIRDQDLSVAQHLALTDHFGTAVPHPLSARPGLDPDGLCIVFENRPGLRGARNDFWHSDISCAPRPPAVSILHAVTVPEGRGDTMFCNMYSAWKRLSPGLQAMLAPLTAVHAMHYAHYDYDPDEPRRMHRTTVGGERPAAAFGG